MQDSRTDHKFAQQRRRNKAQKEIDIAISGHAVIFLTPYQIRVDGVLDLYPTSRLYHHIPTKERGSFEKAQEVVDRFLGGSNGLK